MGKQGGWIRVYRSLCDPDHDLHPARTGEPACKAWAWVELMLLAKWEDDEGLERGELSASVRFLASRWNWTRGRTHRFLESLRDANRVITRTQTGRVPGRITICKYELYQDPSDAERDADQDAGRDAERDKDKKGRNNNEKELPLPRETSESARAVFAMCEDLGVRWPLKRTIHEWAHEIDNDPRWAALDIPYEVKACSDWWQGKQNGKPFPKNWCADQRLRSWFRNQVKWDKPKRSSSGASPNPLALTRDQLLGDQGT